GGGVGSPQVSVMASLLASMGGGGGIHKRHVEALCADLLGVPISAGLPQQHLPLQCYPTPDTHRLFDVNRLCQIVWVRNCHPTVRDSQPALGTGCRVTVG